MLDQSFSAKTFQELFDKENRKGKNLEKRFKDDFQEALLKQSELKAHIKAIRNERDPDTKKLLSEKKRILKKERETLISKTLESISENINNHNIQLSEEDGLYKLENKVQNFFISKKIQDNICRTYNVKQSNRYSILSEVINLLEDEFPKYVIRTDIKRFYESIPQKKLLGKISDDHLLSIKTKSFIKNIFENYNRLTSQTDPDTARGVPRGIGISAYLSELFMRKIDRRIRDLKDVIYYGRFVDDIIIVFVPENINADDTYYEEYLKSIKTIINEEGGDNFILNEEKTQTYNLTKGLSPILIEKRHITNGTIEKINIIKPDKAIQFLGYRIGSLSLHNQTSTSTKVKKTECLLIELSENKIKRTKDKIKMAFLAFEKNNSNRNRHFKLLTARIKYLTGNTKLRNSKEKIFVGIFYSNPFLTGDTSLNVLQRSLKYYISRSTISTIEKTHLKQYSFTEGFKKKTFELLPLKNRKYKNHNRARGDSYNRNNNGIVQFGITEINSIWKK